MANRSTPEIKTPIKVNGLKNGFINDTNHVISRDDNLILVPEPTNKQTEDEQISFDENKV